MGIAFGGYDKDDDWGGSGASWWTICKSDPRFNMSGSAYGIFDAASNADKAIAQKAKLLDIAEDDIPADIEIGACKS